MYGEKGRERHPLKRMFEIMHISRLAPRNCKAISGTKSSQFYELQRVKCAKILFYTLTGTSNFGTLGGTIRLCNLASSRRHIGTC